MDLDAPDRSGDSRLPTEPPPLPPESASPKAPLRPKGVTAADFAKIERIHEHWAAAGCGRAVLSSLTPKVARKFVAAWNAQPDDEHWRLACEKAAAVRAVAKAEGEAPKRFIWLVANSSDRIGGDPNHQALVGGGYDWLVRRATPVRRKRTGGELFEERLRAAEEARRVVAQ